MCVMYAQYANQTKFASDLRHDGHHEVLSDWRDERFGQASSSLSRLNAQDYREQCQNMKEVWLYNKVR